MNGYALILTGIVVGILLPSIIRPFYQAIQELIWTKRISRTTADNCSMLLFTIGLIPALLCAAITITPDATIWSLVGTLIFTLLVALGVRFFDYRKL